MHQPEKEFHGVCSSSGNYSSSSLILRCHFDDRIVAVAGSIPVMAKCLYVLKYILIYITFIRYIASIVQAYFN